MAVGLMIGGIALLGTVTAMLASWLVAAVAAEKEQADDLQGSIRRLEAKIDRLSTSRYMTLTKLTPRPIESHRTSAAIA